MPLRISHQELSANRWTTDRDMTFTDMLLSLLESTAAAAEAKNMGEHCLWPISLCQESKSPESPPVCEHNAQQQAMSDQGVSIQAALCVTGVCYVRGPLPGTPTYMCRPASLSRVVGAAGGARAQSAARGGSAGCAAGPGGCAGFALCLQCSLAQAMDW